jgi:hypothetical protein
MSSNFKPVSRLAERNAMCRACQETIPKGTPMISWWSYLNSGMHIHLHEQCAIDIGNMAIEAQYERVKDV